MSQIEQQIPTNAKTAVDGLGQGANQFAQKSIAGRQQPERLSGQNLNKLDQANDQVRIGGENIAIIRETLAELDDEDGMTKIDLENYQFNQSKGQPPGAGNEAIQASPAKRASQLSLGSQSQGQFSTYKLP